LAQRQPRSITLGGTPHLFTAVSGLEEIVFTNKQNVAVMMMMIIIIIIIIIVVPHV